MAQAPSGKAGGLVDQRNWRISGRHDRRRRGCETIGSGIIPASILNVHIVVIILGSSAISLFIANIAGIPLSTSEVTVGSIVGVGVAFQAVFTDKLW
ncbi:hypothetical protein PO124_18695 [Bacillus licheniformis]|nr:hypothetical protein [Bacillus licheniformis]